MGCLKYSRKNEFEIRRQEIELIILPINNKLIDKTVIIDIKPILSLELPKNQTFYINNYMNSEALKKEQIKKKGDLAYSQIIEKKHIFNKKRIFDQHEGICSICEFYLVKDFVEKNRQYKILEYEWEVVPGQTHKGKGDLILSHAGQFLIIEAKFIKIGELTKKFIKVIQQARKYYKCFKERIRSNFYGKNFSTRIKLSKIFCCILTNINGLEIIAV